MNAATLALNIKLQCLPLPTLKFKHGTKKWKKTTKTYFKEGLNDTGHCILENWMAQAQLSSQTYNEPQ